nr:NADH dehydrogenase subunit 4L [Argyropelecus aculeatus]
MSPTHFSFTASFILGFTGLSFHRAHLLSALLCLEGMMLSLFISLSVWALYLEATSTSPTPMVVLAFSACEASAGLSLLVATARTHGSDLTPCLTTLRC